jgi:sulfur carrier protein
MILVINGEKREIKEGANILEVIDSLENKTEFFAVALNKNFIPKTQYAKVNLKENDQLEVVTPHPGG